MRSRYPCVRRPEVQVQITITRSIAAPIARVFDLIAQPEQQKRWMKGLESTEWVAGDAPGTVGARFRQRIRQGKQVGEYEGAVTGYERPTLYAVSVGNERFRMDVEYRLTRLDGRTTRLDYAVRAAEGGFWQEFLGTVFRPLTRRVAKEQVTRLAEVAEQG
jgi:uncharacterized protein YndB with AHSA1/START domain